MIGGPGTSHAVVDVGTKVRGHARDVVLDTLDRYANFDFLDTLFVEFWYLSISVFRRISNSRGV